MELTNEGRGEAVRRSRRLAVLIDADNTSPKWADAIFQEVATFGDAIVRRIYGDFASGGLKGWEDVLRSHAVIPHHQIAYTKGKNSSDIALVIDAMDLLHSGPCEGFVLVSSDSDFTRLASRAREAGLDVFGIGEKKTPDAFRKACKRFIFVENLLAEDIEADEEGGRQPENVEAGQQGAHQPNVATSDGGMKKFPPSKVVPLVRKAMANPDGEEWVSLSAVGSYLHRADPEFDVRAYGCAKLSDLVERTGNFEVDRKRNRLRVKDRPSK